MNIERDKFLTEVMGLCWHEPRYKKRIRDSYDGILNDEDWCPKCKQIYRDLNHFNFSTWESFGMLWEWAVKKEWWKNFLDKITKVDKYDTLLRWSIITDVIFPDKFADAVYEFLKEI